MRIAQPSTTLVRIQMALAHNKVFLKIRQPPLHNDSLHRLIVSRLLAHILFISFGQSLPDSI